MSSIKDSNGSGWPMAKASVRSARPPTTVDRSGDVPASRDESDGSHRLGREPEYAVGVRRSVDKPQPSRPVHLPEQPLAGAEEERVEEQAVSVDEVVRDELLDEHPAAQHGDVAVAR